MSSRGVAIVVGLLAVSAAFLVLDRRSLERGNRLFRAGAVPEAVDVYGRSAEGGSPAARYNLGTALLAVAPDSAEAHLAAATAAEDSATAQRAWYNLGWHHLAAGSIPQEPDASRASLEQAIEALTTALRMSPGDEAVRWNLALAHRLLSQLTPPSEEAGRQSGSESEDEVAMRDPSMARSDEPATQEGPQPEDPRPTDNSGERRGPLRGARESWAEQDPGPLSRADALGLLTTISDEPEALVKGILWSHRPDVAWWAGQAYPGGSW